MFFKTIKKSGKIKYTFYHIIPYILFTSKKEVINKKFVKGIRPEPRQYGLHLLTSAFSFFNLGINWDMSRILENVEENCEEHTEQERRNVITKVE